MPQNRTALVGRVRDIVEQRNERLHPKASLQVTRRLLARLKGIGRDIGRVLLA